MPSNAQIISDLRVVMDTNHDLELINIYRGVPFVCKAQVTQMNGDQAHIHTNHPSLLCLQLDQQTKVLGSDYFEPAQAQVMSVNLKAGQAVLSNFAYMGTRLGERMVVRVEPRPSTKAQINCQDVWVQCELADLSMSGMGVRVDDQQYHSVLRPGASLETLLYLPQGEIKTSGTILSSSRSSDSHRISVRFTADHAHKLAVFHYLVERRAEIEQELVEAYQQALQAA